MDNEHEHLVVLSCGHEIRVWVKPGTLDIYAYQYCSDCGHYRVVMSVSDVEEIMAEAVRSWDE